DGVPSLLVKNFRDKLDQNGPFAEKAFLLEYFYKDLSAISHYLPEDAIIWFYEISDFNKKIEEFFGKTRQSLYSSRDEGKLCSLGANLYLTPEEIKKTLSNFTKIWAQSLDVFSPEKNTINFYTAENKDIHQIIERKTHTSPFAKLIHKLQEWLNDYYVIVLVSYSEIQKKRLQELLQNYGLNVKDHPKFSFPNLNQTERQILMLTLGQIQKGFRSPEDKIIVLTEQEIFGEKIYLGKKFEIKESYPISSLTDLRIEDFVVHVDYGIGKYKGLHSLEINGNRNDYLLIEYRDGDRLYVPIYRLNLVQKYRGGEKSESPPLNKLGGKSWLQTKKRIKKSIMAHAKELLRIYAARQALKGFSFSPRDQYYREFEARFEYEETPDQANAIEDVMRDMESPRPMDRLICGDVGYGKTEVALRASFKAVMDNKQVAVLVPTTILAHQHYQTFVHRFREFPVNIAMLSRFQSARQQKEIVHQLKEGKIDIVIGTHRLLQKDIGFKDLGLVIIDEEHRFGVNHKEKLKKLRNLVDVLALTATPIPRTLQLSLLGIRDLSIINSPPEDRLAVRTYITHFDGKIIREAILREFMREGQVFFVHNRVERIEAMAHYLKELVPEAKLAIAHGQMPEKELEEVMWSFQQRQINLLLCTSIIESGLDFPHANTIIVNRADKMGLAQLYQLRGRVGRSNHQAYAYFLIPKEAYLTKKAKERLKAISEFSALSSGFRLANFDLEIRGGGNILGLSQSGHMAQVGIELYYQLIEKAVKEIKGEKVLPDVDPEFRLDIPAYIPEEYIPDVHQRLRIYRKLSGGIDENEISDVKDELRDRFGPIPQVVENLLAISSLKPVLKKYLITSLGFNGKEIVLAFHPEAESSLDKVLALIQKRGDQLKFTPDHKLLIPFSVKNDWKEMLEEVKEIF
ncbi:MAG: transcription-repair coupling factor, partial [Deltaproteobacteria bacterium]